MAHLASGSSAGLSVEVESNAGLGERGLEARLLVPDPQIAEQIHDRTWAKHRRITQRQITHGTYELLELTRGARDLCLVKRIVWPWCELVDVNRAVAQQEQLDGHDSLQRKGLANGPRHLDGATSDVVGERSGDH